MADYGFKNRRLEIREDGTALNTSTTETSILPGSGFEFTTGAGAFKFPFALAFFFSGRISTRGTAGDTLKLRLFLGSVAVLDSGLMPLTSTALTNVHWNLYGEIVCRATGLTTTTTFFPKGCKWDSHAIIGAPAITAGGAPSILLPYNSAPAVGSGLDFSASQLLDLKATWSVSNASNSIQLHAGHIDINV